VSRYPNEDVARFDQQFAETPAERNERHRERRLKQTIVTLQKLIADLASGLSDEGPDWSQEGLDNLRRRVANALPPNDCPGCCAPYRDPPMVRS
jgi:hypothetical protein